MQCHCAPNHTATNNNCKVSVHMDSTVKDSTSVAQKQPPKDEEQGQKQDCFELNISTLDSDVVFIGTKT